jgi:predicted  nucleic acid-binding Zn-ribbon protein
MPDETKAPSALERLQLAASDAHRVAAIASTGTAELAETLKAADDARKQLQDALDHCLKKIERLRQDHEALLGRIKALEAEKDQIAQSAKDAMAAAEAVRREGIDALEEARQLGKRK